MRQKRCKVGAAILAHDYGKTLIIGQVVDLDERLPGGGTLADVIDAEKRPDWFEEVEPAPAIVDTPRRRRGGAQEDVIATPASPAAEEESHG